MSMVMLVVLFVMTLLLSVPIAVGIGIASLPVVVDSGASVMYIAQKMFSALDSFTLLAIPFFILAGMLMEGGGISKRIINFANVCVGNNYGGLAIVTIVAAMFFAAVSGSGSATTATLGSVLIPAMVKKGYDVRFASATTASASQIGVIIPPSIPMVLYCVGTNNSIGTIFLAGFLPGIMIGLTLIAYAKHTCKKRNYAGDRKYSRGEKIQAFKEAIWALLMPVIILGGIYAGIFTPTESAAVACIYAVIVAVFVYREMSFKDIPRIFFKASITVAVVMIILSSAGLFSAVLTYMKVPQMVAGFFLSVAKSKYVFLLIVNILLFFCGMFFDGGPVMIILAPILAPVAVSMGIDPIHFGIIMVVNSAVGQITPPFGVNLFVASQVAGIKMESMVKELLPYIGIIVLDIFIITYVPQISLALPRLFGM